MIFKFEINTQELEKVKVNDVVSIETKEDAAKPILGIYKLIKEDVVVYVGLSKDILKRIEQHRKEGKNDFDRNLLIECEERESKLIEITLIHFYSPLHNKHHKKKD